MMRMSSKETGHPVCSIIKVNYPNHFTNFLLKRLKSFIASSKQMTRLISIRSYLLYTFLSKNLKHLSNYLQLKNATCVLENF